MSDLPNPFPTPLGDCHWKQQYRRPGVKSVKVGFVRMAPEATVQVICDDADDAPESEPTEVDEIMRRFEERRKGK